MYTGYAISQINFDEIAKEFPPMFPDVIGHHVTIRLGADVNMIPPTSAFIYLLDHYTDNKSIECFTVQVFDKVKRSDGGTYHLTWSIDRSMGVKPQDSNSLINKSGDGISITKHIHQTVRPFWVDGKVFT